MEPEKIIKDFLTQMATQSNRGTADIFYYVIRDKTRRLTKDGCGEITVYADAQDDYREFESKEDFAKQSREDDEDITDDEIDTAWDNLEELSFTTVYEEKGLFLTETDAEDHLRQNRHHYSYDAYTYVKHAWRAPELKNFFKALFEHFKVEKTWG